MKLVVNADDFGRTPGVSAGIVRAHREGIVTATTLMVNAPDTAGAAALARAEARLDVGVHLTLTYGRPLGDPARLRSIVRADGTFPRPSALLERSIDRDEALAEYRAQYRRAHELVGRAPTHLDSHHWVHDHPALEWAIGELGRETGAAVRIHDAGQRDRLRARGVRTPDRFIREFQHKGNIGVERLVAILRSLGPGDGVVELMCHPGEPDAALLSGSAYARERAVELATLTDPRVRDETHRLGIELVTFAAV